VTTVRSIRARGTGLPGRGGPRRWPSRWRRWIRRSTWRTAAFRRIERFLRSWGVGYRTTDPYAFLLSYPRSGNHLIRYVIESVSGYPTWGASAGRGRKFTSRSPDTAIHLKVPLKMSSRRAIVIKRHVLHRSDDRRMSVLLLVRRPDQAIVSHLGERRLDANLAEFTQRFIDMCVSVDGWPATTSIHFLEDFTQESSEGFHRAAESLLSDIHLTRLSVPLSRFTANRTEHFARALWSLERRPQSAKVDWESTRIRQACEEILAMLNSSRTLSPTLNVILTHYFGETPRKRMTRQT
jgi:hypothetical protein